jgi:hypothetical protein
MDICRQCFREKAADIGFFKVGFSRLSSLVYCFVWPGYDGVNDRA